MARPQKRHRPSGDRIKDIPSPDRVTIIKVDQLLCSTTPSSPTTGSAAAAVAPPTRFNYYEQQRNLVPTVSLSQLIAPLDERTFLSECFRKCAVHAPDLLREHKHHHREVDGDDDDDGGEIDDRRRTTTAAGTTARVQYLSEQLFDLDPGSILRATSSDNVFVWLRNSNNNDNNRHQQHHHSSSTSDLIQSIECDPDTALALYRSGHATYCRAPRALENHLVSSLLAGTGLGCGQYDPTGESMTCLGRGEVEVFISTPNHTTDWHIDFQENFTIQLSGIKKWTLQKGTVRHPIRGCTPHYRSPESVEPQLKAAHLADEEFEFRHPVAGINAVGENDSVIVKPGDVLYFPAGMWHRVETLEPGVSINVSLMAANYATVTCQAIQHLLLRREEWRESITINSTTNAIEKLKSLLHELPGIISEFEREGGAEAIIPPAVRQGQALGINDVDSSDEEGETHDIIDVCDNANSKWKCNAIQVQEQLRTHRVVRNPLATLLRGSDIYKFYKTCEDDDEEEEDDGEEDGGGIYVLNVNYAGTETHESMVRKCIKDRGMLLRHIYSESKGANKDSKNDGLLLPPLESWVESETDRSMLGCLVYYGYLLWVARE